MESSQKQIIRATLSVVAATVLIIAAVISCLSCRYDMRGGLTDEQKQQQAKLLWEGLISDTSWTPQISHVSTGITPFVPNLVLDFNCRREGTDFKITYTSGGLELETATLQVNGTTGLLTYRNRTPYHVTFSRNPDGTDPVIAIYYTEGNATCYSLLE